MDFCLFMCSMLLVQSSSAMFYLEFIPLRDIGRGTVVKVLCYKSEGRWLDLRWGHWNFSLT